MKAVKLIIMFLVFAMNVESQPFVYIDAGFSGVMQSSGSWIDYNKDFDWYICSSAYIAEINSTANKLKQYIWITSFILLALALVISAYLFKKLLKPIEVLSRKALQVKNGDLSVRSQIRVDDEIGTLAQTFDGMLDTIEENVSTLDRKVNERTEDLQEMVEKLNFLASHDPMTGIYNRRKFFELANPALNENSINLYAAMMDIDNFKKINDTHGHQVGDMVLKQFADLVTETVRDSDVVCRYGGEELLVILPHTKGEAALIVAENLRVKIEKTDFVVDCYEVDTQAALHVTASFGVTALCSEMDTVHRLLGQADKALYFAKKQGRNKAVSCADLDDAEKC